MHARTRFVTRGGGVGALVGFLPLLVGSAFVALGVLVARGELDPASPPDPRGLIFSAAGALPAMVGLWLLLGRSGVTLDRARRVVVRWSGLLGAPLWRTSRDVPDRALVTIESVARRQGKTTVTLFPVKVVAGSDGPVGRGAEAFDPRGEILLGEPPDHLEGRRIAERAGKAFGLDVEDRTVAPPSRRRADQLDASLRQQHRGAPPPRPLPPASPRCTLRRGRGQVTIDVPPGEPIVMIALRAATGCLGLFLLAPVAFAAMALPGAVAVGLAVAVVGLALAAGWSILASARRATNPTIIEVGPEAVSVARIDRRESIPLDELEEVVVETSRAPAGTPSALGGGARLILLSDERRLEVWLSLDPDERDWLRDMVRFVAATGEAPPEGDAPAAR